MCRRRSGALRITAIAALYAAVDVQQHGTAFGTPGNETALHLIGRLAELRRREAQSPSPFSSIHGFSSKGIGGGVAESDASFEERESSCGGAVIRRKMDLPEELAALQRFHGHLGVYVTLGLRMGAIGKRRFGHYKGLRALVEACPEPPMRCVLDGVQFSSGCTMGKGNIQLESASEPAVTFEKEGRRLRVALKPGWREKIDGEMAKEKEIEQSVFYYEIPESDVFEVHDG